MSSIKRAMFVATAALILPASANACEPVSYSDDHQRLMNALDMLAHSKAAIDGAVTSGAQNKGSVATIRPTKVWFGPKQRTYRVILETMSSEPFRKGDRVRVLLFNEQAPWDMSERLKRVIFFWRWHAYEADRSEFKWAIRFKEMQAAVKKREQSRIRDGR